jgi:trimeric autotransporter adhesin
MKTNLSLMKINPLLLLALLMFCGTVGQAGPVGTAFTYQGRLTDSGQCANGLYDFVFTLYSDPNGLDFVANNINTTMGIPVTNGLFTVTNLDFGTSPFAPGQALWLQIQVRTNNTPPYGTLSPLEGLAPTPYAIAAENVNGSVPASQLTGTLSPGLLSGTYGNAVTLNNVGNSFTGNGAGLTGVNAVTLGGLGAANFWQLTGNAGTTPGVNFVGTTDNEPLELSVNGHRGMEILVPASDSPNLVGGFSGNIIDPGLNGAVIAGGGTANFLGQGSTNHVSASYASIGGGGGNWIQSSADHSVIGGGWNNLIGAYQSVVAGGENNTMPAGATWSVIGGGWSNTNQAQRATIAGGVGNTIQGNANQSFIGGGGGNTISANDSNATIGGGNANGIQAGSDGSFIGGGEFNYVVGGIDSSIGAGNGNVVYSGNDSAIGGGNGNYIVGGNYATIGGGVGNDSDYDYSSIGGGSNNLIEATGATIPGGANNVATGNYSFAAGQNAHANSNNSFVWSDGSTAAYDHGPNTFTILATNGFHFVAGGGSVNIDANGNLSTPVLTITGGADVAEPFQMSSTAIPKGSVVIIDEEHPGRLKLSDRPYDRRVAGIVSGANGVNPGISLRQVNVLNGDQNVALSGRVYVLADASYGTIRPGDMLTTSATPGRAMKVTDHARAQGAILGKAMTGLSQGKGMVLVLVTLQ